TQRLEMPPGVGVTLPKGSQLMLNLHIYNTSDSPLTGMSGVLTKEVAAASVTQQAEALLIGPLQFTIDPGVHTVDGRSTMSADAQILAVGPHMHKLGTHMSAMLGTTTMLLDRDYTFDEQYFTPLMVHAKAGDRITTVCTYNNDTGVPVGFGQSTDT